jgi:phosphoserine phosphatase
MLRLQSRVSLSGAQRSIKSAPSAKGIHQNSSMIRSAATTAAPPTPTVLETIRNADAYCFDVDSTFCSDESIDELADFLGRGDEVAALTRKAMSGSVDFRTALAGRLEVIQPTQQSIHDFLQKNPHKISKGIPELLKLLKSQGKEVFLVSGGFRQVIHPLAEEVGIPITNVFANNVLFDTEGKYAGFDEKEFTCASGGKPAALKHIKATRNLKSVVMVGDGATDAETKEAGEAAAFIGYGGSVRRENVVAKSCWFIMDIQELINALS